VKSYALGFVWLGIAVLFLALAQGGMQWDRHGDAGKLKALEERVRALEHSLECVQGEAGELRRRSDTDHWKLSRLIHDVTLRQTGKADPETLKEGR
jgi:hypothetical protein